MYLKTIISLALVSSFFTQLRFVIKAMADYAGKLPVSVLKASSCTLLSLCLLSLPLSAADDDQANTEFHRLKTTYEKELQKLSSPDLEEIVSEQDKYLAALRNIQKKVQAAGELERLLAVKSEIDRFSMARKITTDDLSKDVPELVPFQNAYIRATGKLSVDRARKIVTLAENYEKALENLQVSLTKKDDLRGAVEAKTEKDNLTNSAELMEARALILETEALAAKEKQSETNTVETLAQKNTADKAAARPAVANNAPVKKKYSESPEKRINQRFEDLSKCILKQDFSQAAKFVDPAYVKTADANKLRRGFMDAFPFLQLPESSSRKIRIASLKINDKADTATLTQELWAGYQWNPLPANKWIETEGDWYLDISEVEKIRPIDLIRLERAEQTKPWNRRSPRISR